MKSKSLVFYSVAIFGALVSLGFYLMWTNSAYQINPTISRIPTSIIDLGDSDFSDEGLANQLKARILKGLHVMEWKDQSGIKLGGVFISSSSGENVFVCDELPSVVLVFEGEGVAHSGAKPLLELSGPCLEAEGNLIDALLLPSFQLAQRDPFDGEFLLPEQDAKATFYNTSEGWPTAWALTGIYFENSLGEAQLEISLSDLMRWVGHPVGITWPTDPVSE